MKLEPDGVAGAVVSFTARVMRLCPANRQTDECARVKLEGEDKIHHGMVNAFHQLLYVFSPASATVLCLSPASPPTLVRCII